MSDSKFQIFSSISEKTREMRIVIVEGKKQAKIAVNKIRKYRDKKSKKFHAEIFTVVKSDRQSIPVPGK